MKKCLKTITGKHIWKDTNINQEIISNSFWAATGEISYLPKCLACGVIDDTVTVKKVRIGI